MKTDWTLEGSLSLRGWTFWRIWVDLEGIMHMECRETGGKEI
jgi:hypothetical protein